MKKQNLILLIMIIAVVLTVYKDVIIEERVIKNVVKKYEISLINLSSNEITMRKFNDEVKKISTKEFQKSILMKSFFNHSGADLLKMSAETYEKIVYEFNQNMKQQFGLINNNSIEQSQIFFNDDYNAYMYTKRESTIHTSDDQKNVQLFVFRKYELVRENYEWYIASTYTSTRYFNEGEVDYTELENFLLDGDTKIKFNKDILN